MTPTITSEQTIYAIEELTKKRGRKNRYRKNV